MQATYALLGIANGGPSYGYEMKKRYDALFANGKPLAFGQVYATLSRLVRDQKMQVEKTEEQSGGPERKRYVITAAGRQDLERWLALPEGTSTRSQSVFFTKVVTSILIDASPQQYLDVQRAAHIQRMRELTDKRRKGDIAEMLRADYELFHLEADLRWIDLTVDRLANLTEEITHATER
jgi:DNA-binding PadR family transcriptional regulator